MPGTKPIRKNFVARPTKRDALLRIAAALESIANELRLHNQWHNARRNRKP